METYQKQCYNECPECGESDIEWKERERRGDYIVHFGLCLTCDTEFTEYYSYEVTAWQAVRAIW